MVKKDTFSRQLEECTNYYYTARGESKLNLLPKFPCLSSIASYREKVLDCDGRYRAPANNVLRCLSHHSLQQRQRVYGKALPPPSFRPASTHN
ncbi:hypothetical protein E4T56_gene10583 [Termitomyces sp. T112]|nr:hypothetical protein E4T56_gene10583 [Termitomyces sp. T112]